MGRSNKTADQFAKKFVSALRQVSGQLSPTPSQIVWSKVTGVRSQGYLDVSLASDPGVTLTDVVNQSDSQFAVDDYAVLYLIGGQLNNAYIIGKVGSASMENQNSNSAVEVKVNEVAPGMQPEQIFTVQCTGPAVFTTASDGQFAFVPCRMADGRAITAWWRLGQPFDGLKYALSLKGVQEGVDFIAANHTVDSSQYSSTPAQTVKYWWEQISDRVNKLRQSILIQAQNEGSSVILTAPLLDSGTVEFRTRVRPTYVQATPQGADTPRPFSAELQILDVILLNPTLPS